jgi:L-fuconolactonase
VIVDSHCHAWRRWPYHPLVPDPESRGSVDQLLYEMDRNGVDMAAIVCARIGSGEAANDDNNDYVARAAARYPDRLVAVVDVDSCWRPEHHAPGAARRLTEIVGRTGASGFTHYVAADNDGWLVSADGLEFFATAAEHDLVASLALTPAWQDDLLTMARSVPTLPILVHHLGLARPAEPNFPADLASIVASGAEPNIVVKVSGFHYISARAWDFPYADAREVFRAIYEAYGAHRLCWGSDFPAAMPFLTYAQSLEVVRSHCDFLDRSARDLILGDTMAGILQTRRVST